MEKHNKLVRGGRVDKMDRSEKKPNLVSVAKHKELLDKLIVHIKDPKDENTNENYKEAREMVADLKTLDSKIGDEYRTKIDNALTERHSNKSGGVGEEYSGTAKEIWNNWNIGQREHFLNDHSNYIDKLINNDKSIPKGMLISEIYTPYSSARKPFVKLNKNVKAVIEEHIKDDKYAKGGEVESSKKSNWFSGGLSFLNY